MSPPIIISLILFSLPIFSNADITLLNTTANEAYVGCLRSGRVSLRKCESDVLVAEMLCGNTKCEKEVYPSNAAPLFLDLMNGAWRTGPYPKTQGGLTRLKEILTIETNLEKFKELNEWLINLQKILEIQNALASEQQVLKVSSSEELYGFLFAPFEKTANEKDIQSQLPPDNLQLSIDCDCISDFFISCRHSLLGKSRVWMASEPVASHEFNELVRCSGVKEIIKNTPVGAFRFAIPKQWTEADLPGRLLIGEREFVWGKLPKGLGEYQDTCPWREEIKGSNLKVTLSCKIGLNLEIEEEVISSASGVSWENFADLGSRYSSWGNLLQIKFAPKSENLSVELRRTAAQFASLNVLGRVAIVNSELSAVSYSNLSMPVRLNERTKE